MGDFLALAIAGAVSGAIYSLLAVGLTLTYSASGIFNLGLGAVAFTTAFLYYELLLGFHWHIVPAAILCIFVFAPLLGLVLDRLIFRPLTQANETAKIIAPVGLLVALPAIAFWLVGGAIDVLHWNIPSGDNVYLPPGIGPDPADHFRIAQGVTISTDQVIVFAVAAIMSLALWLLLRRTSLGLRIRATVDSRKLAELRGIDPGRTSAVVWAVGTLFAGLAGVVGAPIFNSLLPGTYLLILLVATTAAVAGRLRSIPIAFAGGLILGIVQNLVAGYANFANKIQGFGASVPAVLLLFALVVLGRERVRLGGSGSDDVAAPDYLADLSPWRRAAPWAVALAFLLSYIFWIGNSYWVGIVTEGLAFGFIFLSFVLVTGVGGMVSLAQAAFVTAAALTAGLLMSHGWPFLPALLGGAAVATALGIIVALPALRVGGVSLALATLALALIGDRVLFAWQYLAGSQGAGWSISRPALGPLHFSDNRSFAVLLLVLIAVVSVLIRNLRRSASGRAMVTVRSSEVAAATLGISSMTTKLAVFASSAVIAGIGGVLLASFNGGANNSANPTTAGLIWLAAVVLFGIGRPMGAVVAGLMSAIFPGILSAGIHWPAFVPTWFDWNGTKSVWLPEILFGLGAIQMARYPDGALLIVGAQNQARRHRREERRIARRSQVSASTTESPSVPLTASGQSARSLERQSALQLPDSSVALSLEGIHAGYASVQVLHGVDLQLERRSIMCILGANGAGKSTLCGVISGHVAPVNGAIRLGSEDVTALRPFQRARKGIVLAPESRGIFPGLTVEENLSIWLPKAAERAEAYERFEILKVRRSLPAGNLSGGEQQMLTLAPVLVRPPDVLVADEPTLGLAPLVINSLLSLFRELAERGVAILLVEEKARDMLAIADRVAILDRGEVVWRGLGSEVEAEALTNAYLGGIAETSTTSLSHDSGQSSAPN